MNSTILSNRTAIVTGGSSGIGRGIAIELAREGAKVIVADVREAPKTGKYYDTDLETTTVEQIENLGSKGWFVTTDVSDENQVKDLVSQTVERFGNLDILVNNAGIYVRGNSQTLSIKDWDRTIATNFRAVFLLSKYAVPHLKESKAGRIINISSIQCDRGGGGPAYPATKAAVVNFTRDLALEVAENSITVNAICPGFIESPIQDYMTLDDIEACQKKTALPRFGKPHDIGRACVFLASNDAEWITGTSLVVDGGWSASLM